MALFSGGGFSIPDFPLLLLFILLSCLSLPLTGCVLRHNYLKRPSLSRSLYLALYTLDLLVNTICSPGSAISIWVPPDNNISCATPQMREQYYYMCLQSGINIPTSRILYSSVAFGLFLGPMVATGMLIIVRFISIRSPLYLINRKLVLAVLGSSLFSIPLISLVLILIFPRLSPSFGQIYSPVSNLVYPRYLPAFHARQHYVYRYWPLFIINSPVLAIQVVAMVTTCLTVYQLTKAQVKSRKLQSSSATPAPSSRVSGTIKILIMNCASFITFVSLITSWSFGRPYALAWEGWMAEGAPFIISYFVIGQVFPGLTSLLNVAVYIGLSRDRVLVRSGGRNNQCNQRSHHTTEMNGVNTSPSKPVFTENCTVICCRLDIVTENPK